MSKPFNFFFMQNTPFLRWFPALLSVGLAAAFMLPCSTKSDDWPEWRGLARNGISKETGWLSKWPAEGVKKLWEVSVGVGYSTMSVSKGRVYTMGNVEDTDWVSCFDAETGKPLWKHEYACPAKDPNGYHGTRCTPTVDGNRVYTLSRHGHFFCLEAETGKVIWSKDFTKDFGGVTPKWGFSGSPLIEKGWVLSEASGTNGASVVAFDKLSGAVAWKSGDDRAGYSSLITFDNGGEHCFAQFSADHIIGRRMKDGSELWRSPWKTDYGVNAATPIIEGDQMFLSSGYGFGCALLKIAPTGATEVWRNKNMRNHVNSCVLVDGYLYGYDDAELKCLDWKTGLVKWTTKDYGKGALTVADGKLILFGQNGKLGVAEISPEAFKPISSFQAMGGKNTWASPVLANGRIYVRGLDKMAAFDVKGK
jgi:outer membrane protein assembly factor BamB